MNKSTANLKEALDTLRKDTKDFAKKYASNTSKINAINEIKMNNLKIGIALNGVFAAIDGALAVNDLRKDAQELSNAYPELSSLFDVSSEDYWKEFAGALLISQQSLEYQQGLVQWWLLQLLLVPYLKYSINMVGKH